MRIYSVDSISLTLQKSNPPKLAIQVMGTATTTGWTNVRLNPLENQVSADGILDLELVGDPPTGIVLQVLSPVAADLVIDQDVEKIIGVQIHARTNNRTQLLAQDPPVASPPAPGRFTTFALGEETPIWPLPPIPPTTLAIGEEGWPWSFGHGEEPPWKPAVGEKPPGGEDFRRIDDLIQTVGPFGRR
ncbi:MAG: hypothetical protein AAF387_17735 [Pseudomonadota bacterium]